MQIDRTIDHRRLDVKPAVEKPSAREKDNKAIVEPVTESEKKSNVQPLAARAASSKPVKKNTIVEIVKNLEQPLKSNKQKKKKFKTRHIAIVASFLAFVSVPSSIFGGYMAFIAADQYSSFTSFSIRSIGGASSAGDIMGFFTQSSGSNVTSDSYILMDYIQSADLLTQIESNFDLEKIYARRGLDYFYAMSPGQPIEDRVAYWRRMVNVHFDHSSGIISVELKAFDPVDAKNLTEFIIARSEDLINKLSDEAKDQVLRGSRQEVARSELRLMSARDEVRQYRNSTQEIDPTEGARVAGEIVSGLEAKLSELNTALSTARQQMDDDSPRIKAMMMQIASVRSQIDVEKQRMGTGSSLADGADGGAIDKTGRRQDIASRFQRFEAVKTQEEFAQQAYAASLAALEKARIQAEEKQRYLGTFIQPIVSEMAQYPKRVQNTFLAFLAFLFIWASVVMTYYNIRDRN